MLWMITSVITIHIQPQDTSNDNMNDYQATKVKKQKQIRAIFPVQIQLKQSQKQYGYYVYFNEIINEMSTGKLSEEGIKFNCISQGFIVEYHYLAQSVPEDIQITQCIILRQRLFIEINVKPEDLPQNFTITYNAQSTLLPGVETFQIRVGQNDYYWETLSTSDLDNQKQLIRLINTLRTENNLNELSIFDENIAMIKTDDMLLNNYLDFFHLPFGSISTMVTEVNIHMNFLLTNELLNQGCSDYQCFLSACYFPIESYNIITDFQACKASYFYSAEKNTDQCKHAFELQTSQTNNYPPQFDYPLRGNMIFKFIRESLEPNVTECIFFQKEPNYYRQYQQQAYIYNTLFTIDNTSMIRAYGLPLGLFNITCGNKTTIVRLQMQSYQRILEIDMNKSKNFDIDAPFQLSGVFNVSQGQLITFQAGIPLNISEAIKDCLKRINNHGFCIPPEILPQKTILQRFIIKSIRSDPVYLKYASSDITNYSLDFVKQMEITGGGIPSAIQQLDPYNGTFIPASGFGPIITPNGTGSIGGWIPPSDDGKTNGLSVMAIILISMSVAGIIIGVSVTVVVLFKMKKKQQRLKKKRQTTGIDLAQVGSEFMV